MGLRDFPRISHAVVSSRAPFSHFHSFKKKINKKKIFILKMYLFIFLTEDVNLRLTLTSTLVLITILCSLFLVTDGKIKGIIH